MDFKIFWTGAAVEAFEDIVAYVARNSPDTAQRLAMGMVKHTQVLRSFPNIGPIYLTDSKGPVRQISYKKYRILYRIRDDEKLVDIVQVWHGSRREPITFE